MACSLSFSWVPTPQPSNAPRPPAPGCGPPRTARQTVIAQPVRCWARTLLPTFSNGVCLSGAVGRPSLSLITLLPFPPGAPCPQSPHWRTEVMQMHASLDLRGKAPKNQLVSLILVSTHPPPLAQGLAQRHTCLIANDRVEIMTEMLRQATLNLRSTAGAGPEKWSSYFISFRVF